MPKLENANAKFSGTPWRSTCYQYLSVFDRFFGELLGSLFFVSKFSQQRLSFSVEQAIKAKKTTFRFVTFFNTLYLLWYTLDHFKKNCVHELKNWWDDVWERVDGRDVGIGPSPILQVQYSSTSSQWYWTIECFLLLEGEGLDQCLGQCTPSLHTAFIQKIQLLDY